MARRILSAPFALSGSLALALFAPVAFAQIFGPTGFESRANAFTTANQFSPDAAYSLFEGFVVVWYGTGHGYIGPEVWGQRYASNGSTLGSNFLVNTYTTSSQYDPHVAVADNGRFVVVWMSFGEDGDSPGVFGQRFASSGAPEGGPFRVNTTTAGYQGQPAVAQSGNLDFVVVWTQSDAVGSSGVFGQRFLPTGAPAGGPFRVNTATTGDQREPSVTKTSDGSFVVVWEANLVHGPGTYGIVGRRFNAVGAPVGAELDPAAGTSPVQRPSIAATNGGSFVVAWHEYVAGGPDNYFDVFARRLDTTGTPIGSAFRVNTATSSSQNYPHVAANFFASRFAVVWNDQGEVVAQRFGGTGSPVGAPFRVNTFTTDTQGVGSAAMASTGDFIVTWTSAAFISPGQDGNGSGAYYQRFCRSLAGDADGNQAINVSDVLFLINFLFAGGPPPFLLAGDVNGDGNTNVGDVLYLINYLFAGGPPPVCIVEIV